MRWPKRKMYRPSCEKHTWGHWDAFGGNYKLVKRCKDCDSILTIPEFFRIKAEKRLAVEQIQRKHLDLWGY